MELTPYTAIRYDKLAEALQLSRQRVWYWFNGGRVPADRCLRVEALTGIPRHKLRPDVYPAPERGDSGASA